MNLLYVRKYLYPIYFEENRFGLVYTSVNLKDINNYLTSDKLVLESCQCYVKEREKEFFIFRQHLLTLTEKGHIFLFCEEQDQEYILNELANKILPKPNERRK